MSRSTSMELRRKELLKDVSAHVAAVLVDLNIDKAKAQLAGNEVMAHLANHWGGQQIYIPKETDYWAGDHVMEIYNACRGGNFPEVALKFDISVRTVYRIYKRVRRRIIEENQGDLFNAPH